MVVIGSRQGRPKGNEARPSDIPLMEVVAFASLHELLYQKQLKWGPLLQCVCLLPETPEPTAESVLNSAMPSAFGRAALRRSTSPRRISSRRDGFLNKVAIILFAHSRELLEKSDDIPEVIIAEAWPGRHT